MKTLKCSCDWDFFETDIMIADPYCPIHGEPDKWDKELDKAHRESKPKRTKFKPSRGDRNDK